MSRNGCQRAKDTGTIRLPIPAGALRAEGVLRFAPRCFEPRELTFESAPLGLLVECYFDDERVPRPAPILQVTLDDAVDAVSVFTTLMGDEVEPRRQFIEKNAQYVKNLDV